ncbi:hypothetical protein [Litchfieldia alkalitelluris]|uniref:hypothetical protein n=1 Tax=Litchfieldia alkalitelluris TaxID=304268 RepID=UPI000995EABC|nr:hypothetical protein [Litchfieldia alkalitelluris]
MHSNQYYEKLIYQLQQEVQALQQQLQQLNTYINYSNVYEYYIHGLKVDNIKGNFQLGQLTQKELVDSDGIHRFYIGEIVIKEIQDTGTVGLGISEKSDKKKSKEISEDEANEDFKAVYNSINSLLSIENTPDFFQSLSSHKEVLLKVWEFMNDQWDKNLEFTLFYENILKSLNESINPDISISRPNFEEDIYITIASEIEEQAKALLVVGYLVQACLPGYLSKYKNEMFMLDHKELTIKSKPPNTLGTIQQIQNAIKSTFHLKELPSSLEEVVEQPDMFRYLFYQVLHPVIKNGDAEELFQKIHYLLQENTSNIPENNHLKELGVEEQGFLFSKLLEYLNRYPKYILLEYLLLLH